MSKSMILIKKIIFPVLLLQLFYIFVTIILNPTAKTNLLLGLIFFIIAVPQILYLVSSKFKVIAINSFLIFSLVGVFELFFFFKILVNPGINSITLTNFKQRQDIEFLDFQPYLKFAPNVKISSMGSRGSDFTYTWRTDELGFKNKFTNIKDKKFDFIALGDSFTEGMGVSVDNMWSNIISENSKYKIYNAGVQGYSASQMLGTLKLLKKKEIFFDGVIIGAFPNIYTREAKFLKDSISQKKTGTGGIASINKGGSASKNTFLVSFVRSIKSAIENIVSTKSFKTLNTDRYIREIPSKIKTREELIKDENWKEYMKNIKTISKHVKKNDKRVILIQFPQRHEVYFSTEQQKIKNILSTQYYIQLNLLKENLPSFVEIIDLLPVLRLYHKDKPNRLIYFESDGHMNEIGNNLVAEIIIEYLRLN